MVMESETSADHDTIPWSSEANWTIVGGSLRNAITFESSFAPIVGVGEDEDDSRDLNSTTNHQPLVLQPNASDSGPCEITIKFTQKHEVQQIYVRSTARVYEIYYESDLRSGKEYLCTVRCGIAARDEEVPAATDNEEVLSASSKGADDNLSKENLRHGCSRSSEDEWVEVKVPDNSALGQKDNFLPLITHDYYEATAQISDAHPCISVTLRLLSVQSKDSVYVDEVYVFADPVDSTDSENQVDQKENSNGNSIMAMLLPTLLQMSKTKGVTRTQEDKHTSETWKKQNFEESGSETVHSTSVEAISPQEGNSTIADHQKVEFQDVNRASVSASESPSPEHIFLRESNTDLPPNTHVERALDQLSSQMGRIEDLFLRLEENLLKPISSIDARLQRVEQQLEVLTNKQKNSELPSCSRFCAPNFSLVQSDSNSFYHSESDFPRGEDFESNAKSIHSDVQTNSVYGASDSVTVNTTQLLPSLVVTAPEFSTGDDEDENSALERDTDSAVDKPRPGLTVDDALASALAGFVSSIPIHTQEHTPTLSIKAPEFSNEEDTKVEKKASPTGQYEIGADGTESINGSLSNASHLSSLDSERNVVRSFDYNQSEKIAEEVDEHYKHDKGGDKDDEQAFCEKARTEIFQKTDDTEEEEEEEEEEVSSETNNGLVHDKTVIQDDFLLNQTDVIGSEATQEDATPSSDSIAAVETTKEGFDSDKVILRDIFEFSHAASVVDFESPVLDVKFISQNSCDRNCPLETLLSDSPESESAATHAEESPDTTPSPSYEHCDLISVEDDEAHGPATNSQIHVDFDYCSLQEPLSSEGETPLASNMSSSHETFPASLI